MPCIISAVHMLPKPYELFNRFPNRYARKTKFILFYMGNCMIYQSFGIEEIEISAPTWILIVQPFSTNSILRQYRKLI